MFLLVLLIRPTGKTSRSHDRLGVLRGYPMYSPSGNVGFGSRIDLQMKTLFPNGLGVSLGTLQGLKKPMPRSATPKEQQGRDDDRQERCSWPVLAL